MSLKPEDIKKHLRYASSDALDFLDSAGMVIADSVSHATAIRIVSAEFRVSQFDVLMSVSKMFISLSPSGDALSVEGSVSVVDTQLFDRVKFDRVTGTFDVSSTGITSLLGCPRFVGHNLNAAWCKNLMSLNGAPEVVLGNFDLFNCRQLKDFSSLTEHVAGSLFLQGTPMDYMLWNDFEDGAQDWYDAQIRHIANCSAADITPLRVKDAVGAYRKPKRAA